MARTLATSPNLPDAAAGAKTVLAKLAAAFPNQKLPADTITVYAQLLAPYGAELEPAVESVLRHARWFPSVGVIVQEIADRRTAHLPDATGAWALAVQGPAAGPMPTEVRQAANYVGGFWSIRSSTNQDTVRAHFRDAYNSLRAKTVRAAANPGWRGEP